MTPGTLIHVVTCPYCGDEAELTSSREVYGGRDYGPIYLCRPCKAWVGVHKGTTKPLGRLANVELRTWKQNAHAVFDPMWKSGGMKRGSAYAWLADQLGIDVKNCHIGMFDVETCKRVVRICIAHRQNKEGFNA